MVRRERVSHWWMCVLLAQAAVIAEPVNYLDPPNGPFNDEWMLVELSGMKGGYAHTTMSRKGDTITTRTLTFFKLGRADQKIEVSLLHTTAETVDGVPKTFETIQKMGTTELKTTGRIADGEVTVVNTQFGFDTRQTAKLPPQAKMAWGLFRAGIEHGFKPGTTYELDVYEPLMRADGTIKAKVVVGDRVKVDGLPSTKEAVKVTTALHMPTGKIESLSYVDDQGQVLRATTSFAGFDMTLTRVTKQEALKDFEPPEFFMDTLVKIDRAIDRNTANKIRYTLRTPKSINGPPKLPATGMQTPVKRTERTAIVDVARIDQAALRRVEKITTANVSPEYLEPSPSLNINDGALVRMAREAVGDETNPYAIADKLRVFVSREIKDKNLNVGFATASEVCRQREGDCTEHAVLLAALGRARGLPSRIVVGLAYVPSFVGVKNVFGFHMWTQFYIGNQWVDFDAALHESDCSPARIALATSSLRDAAIGDIAFAIMDVLRGLEIEITSIESR